MELFKKGRWGLGFTLFYIFVLVPLSLIVLPTLVAASFIVKAIKQKLGWDKDERAFIAPTAKRIRPNGLTVQ